MFPLLFFFNQSRNVAFRCDERLVTSTRRVVVKLRDADSKKDLTPFSGTMALRISYSPCLPREASLREIAHTREYDNLNYILWRARAVTRA